MTLQQKNVPGIKSIKHEILSSDDHLRILVLSINSPIRDDPKLSIGELSKIYKAYASGTQLITSIDQLNMGKKIGKGAFGYVFLVRDKLTRWVYAMKVISLSNISDFKLRFVHNEIEIYSKLSHPNIARYYGHFSDEKRIYLLLEYVSRGDIYKMIALRGKGLEEKKAAKYIYQVLKAIKYLHSLNIAHRDIKPENILIDIEDNVKLVDFGYAVEMKHEHNTDIVGTIDYLPPEMVKGHAHSLSADIWSIGVLIYELVIGTSPFFWVKGKQETYRKIVGAEYDFPVKIPVSKEVKDLIGEILQVNPKDRPTASEIMKHRWFRLRYTN